MSPENETRPQRQDGSRQRLVSREELIAGHKADGRAVYSREAKRILIEAATRRGASVAAIARQHDLNANQLHAWIRVARKRVSAKVSATRATTSQHANNVSPTPARTLLPVIVREAVPAGEDKDAHNAPVSPETGCGPLIVIRLAEVSIEVNGAVDRANLSIVLDCLGYGAPNARQANGTSAPSRPAR